MKTRLFGFFSCAMVAVGLTGTLRAQDDHKLGGPIDGVENLNAIVRFFTASNAPAGATAILRLNAHDHNGTNTAKMRIATRDLQPGVYAVSGTQRSDAASIDFGTVTVLAPANPNGVPVSNTAIAIPDGVSPMDIATVTISDSNSIPMLTADLVNAPGNSLVVFTARVRVASTNDPAVRGDAVMQAFARRDRQSGHFSMVVHGLAPKSTFHVLVNGADVATVRSNRGGALVVHRLPVDDLTTVTSVELQDQGATTVAEADF